jgi:hypothetical protein
MRKTKQTKTLRTRQSLNEDIQEPPNRSKILENNNGGEGPKCRKRFHQVNKKKLLQMELIVITKKSHQIAALAGTLGLKEFSIHKENIKKQLT